MNWLKKLIRDYNKESDDFDYKLAKLAMPITNKNVIEQLLDSYVSAVKEGKYDLSIDILDLIKKESEREKNNQHNDSKSFYEKVEQLRQEKLKPKIKRLDDTY
jgi:hypothetical protein